METLQIIYTVLYYNGVGVPFDSYPTSVILGTKKKNKLCVALSPQANYTD
jgi:hypothetical protein